MSQPLDLWIEGKISDGKILVTCGNDFCLADMPQQSLPVIPHLEKGQRAILIVQDKGVPEWRIRDAASRKETVLTSGGVSLATLVMAFFLFRKIERWWNDNK